MRACWHADKQEHTGNLWMQSIVRIYTRILIGAAMPWRLSVHTDKVRMLTCGLTYTCTDVTVGLNVGYHS